MADDPNINIGAAYRAGIIAVDADVRNGALATLARLPTLTDVTPTVETPGGYHKLFRVPLGLTFKGNLGDDSGVDVKTLGGMTVAPPSLHRSQRRYEWGWWDLATTEIAQCPDWLLEMITKQPAPSYSPTDATYEDSKIFRRMRDLGWPMQRAGTKLYVRCPFSASHGDGGSSGLSSSTILLPGTPYGAVVCQHSHCRGRTPKQYVEKLYSN